MSIYNTDLVKKEEVSSSMRDFLNPKFQGKIVLSDPTTTGGSNSWYVNILRNVKGMEEGRAYMKELSKSIGEVTRNYRYMTEWVARGKYYIAIGARSQETAEFQNIGAPIAYVDTNEPRIVTAGGGVLHVFKNRPHPNASQVFVNWLLTQEGVSTYAEAFGRPSTRLDVSVKGLPPVLIPRPSDALETVEMVAQRDDFMKLAKEDFAMHFR